MPRRERERDRDRSHFGSSLSPLWEPGCHPGDLVGGLRPPAATFGLQRPFREVLLKSALKLALGREAANSCCKPPGLPIGWTRPSSLASAPGALQRGGPRPQQRRRGRNHPAQPAHPALRGPAEQEAPRVPRRPAELRPEHPAPLPLLHPFKGNSEVETQERTPTATVSRHPPSRTGATPKRTPRPRSSSSSSPPPPPPPPPRPQVRSQDRGHRHHLREHLAHHHQSRRAMDMRQRDRETRRRTRRSTTPSTGRHLRHNWSDPQTGGEPYEGQTQSKLEQRGPRESLPLWRKLNETTRRLNSTARRVPHRPGVRVDGKEQEKQTETERARERGKARKNV